MYQNILLGIIILFIVVVVGFALKKRNLISEMWSFVAGIVTFRRHTLSIWSRFIKVCVNVWCTVCWALRTVWEYIVSKLKVAWLWIKDHTISLWNRLTDWS